LESQKKDFNSREDPELQNHLTIVEHKATVKPPAEALHHKLVFQL